MVDFTGVKAITIPEGSVKKITTNGAVLWEKVTSRLPSEYQEVEYIYIPDTAYINTGWIPSEGALFKIKLSAKTTAHPYPFGTGSNPRLALYLLPGGQSQLYNTSNSADGIRLFSVQYNDIVTIETYSTSLSTESYTIINGNKETNIKAQNTDFNTNLPMLLGAWNYNATSIRKGMTDLYYAKASVKGVDIFEMIPCYRKTDGVIGMYDLVSKTFFTNAGTGNFTKGANV